MSRPRGVAEAAGFERKPFYTPTEFARLASMSNDRVMDLIHAGKLPAARISERIYRIPLAAVLQVLCPERVRTPAFGGSRDPEREWRRFDEEAAAERLPRRHRKGA